MTTHSFSGSPGSPGAGHGSPGQPREPWREAGPEGRAARTGPEPADFAGADGGESAGSEHPFGSGLAGSSGSAGTAPPPDESKRKSSSRRKRSSRRKTSRSSSASGAESGDERSGEEAPASAEKPRRSRRGKRTEAEEAAPRKRKAKASDEEEAGGKRSAKTAEKKATKASDRTRRKRSRRKSSAAEGGSADDAATATQESDGAEPRTSEDAEEGAATETGRKRRRRGSRGGRGRRKKSADAPVGVDVIPGEDDDLPGMPEEAAGDAAEPEKSGRRGRKRASKKGSRKTGDKGKAKDADAEETGGKSRKTKKKAASTKASSKTKPVPRDQVILVNAGDPEETRVAVVEAGRIVDFHMTVSRFTSFVNDIYRGRVVNLEPAIGAAFVDFGQGRNGFLHASDVMGIYGDSSFRLEQLLTARVDADEVAGGSMGEELEDDDGEAEAKDSKPKSKAAGKRGRAARTQRRRTRARLPIEALIKKGQMVVSQITKDAIGDKGPTLTTYISIPGRYLVLMPSLARTGVSRKIEDDKERRRLKRILSSLDIPEGMGVIVRTAGTGKTKKELERDIEYLLAVWADFSKRLVSGRNPMPLYQESDVAIRTMRDLFSARTEKVIVDDPEVYETVMDFTRRLMPEHEDRIELHEGARPLFHTHGVEQDFERIFSRRVELPSGGSIVFDQTEALVAIDVNSGRTREKGAEFEDIALKTNLEAVPEIARQIRLRDLGGIIVCDFIDMMKAGNRRAVERALRDALATDRARSKLGRISQFGLLELTRQRLGPGLSKLVYDACTHCRGSGRDRSPASKAQAILRRLGSALTQKGFSTVEVRAHPPTIDYLKEHFTGQLQELVDVHGRELTLTEVPDQVEDSVLRYLRADGREVRPGGRRKR